MLTTSLMVRNKLINMTQLPFNLSSKLGHLERKSSWLIFYSRKPGHPWKEVSVVTPIQSASSTSLKLLPSPLPYGILQQQASLSSLVLSDFFGNKPHIQDWFCGLASSFFPSVKPYQCFRTYFKHCFFGKIAYGFSSKLTGLSICALETWAQQKSYHRLCSV